MSFKWEDAEEKYELYEFRWRKIKDNSDGTQWWRVSNTQNKRFTDCTSSLACYKIVQLCMWLQGIKEEKPLNHKTLETKARWIVKKPKYNPNIKKL